MGTEETWKLIVGNKRMTEVSVITVKDKGLNKVGNCLSKEKCGEPPNAEVDVKVSPFLQMEIRGFRKSRQTYIMLCTFPPNSCSWKLGGGGGEDYEA